MGRIGEVLGDPVLDHSETGMFGECTERLPEGQAARAVVAADNVRRYQGAQKELEAWRLAGAEKEAFLEVVVHDLANWLTALRIQVQLLRRRAEQGWADGAMLEAGLTAIDAKANRAIHLLGELTDAVRLNAQHSLKLNRAPTDLVALTQRIIAEFHAEALDHRFQLDTTQAELLGSWDADRLARVLENVLANAVKYSPGASTIDIRIACEEAPEGTFVVISVADQGVGIPADDLPHVFERFHRGRNVSGQIVGTGVGLWGSQRIVIQHGGTIAIASAEDQGTTVTVRLPFTVDAEPADVPFTALLEFSRSGREGGGRV